jgi:hypothetical protein
MQSTRYLLSGALALLSAVAGADARDPATDVPLVESAGSAKTLGITSVECEPPSGTPRVARCTFIRVNISEGANHTCTLATTTSVLQMTQLDANTWQNTWPASGACKQASSTLLARSKKHKNRWTIKDTTTVPKPAADASADVHKECDPKVGTKVELSDADAHHARKVDCESFDL